MPALRKPLVELVPADFEALIRDQWSEDELLEFKRTLATAKGDPDRWIVDQTDIGVTAKRDLLAEVVAMANSYGGDVILGIVETDEKPPRASDLVPLPKCVELAHRLELAARDVIKPEIPMLGVRGIPIDGDAGLVVFRAPRSRSAPHRLEVKGVEKECYKRVSDRTETMTMREIRDLTFSAASGIDAINTRFNELRSEFYTWGTAGIPKNGIGVRRQSYRISAVPLSADLYMERVHGDESVRPVPGAVQVSLNGKPYDFMPVVDPYDWRPVLRGTQAEEIRKAERGRLVRLSCDGSFQDLTFAGSAAEDTLGQRSDWVMYPGWHFAAVVNAMRSIERFRRAVGAQAVQYALEVEILANATLPVLRISNSWHETAGAIAEGPHLFPRYQLGEPDTWNDLLNLMWRDSWNLIGIETKQNEIALVS